MLKWVFRWTGSCTNCAGDFDKEQLRRQRAADSVRVFGGGFCCLPSHVSRYVSFPKFCFDRNKMCFENRIDRYSGPSEVSRLTLPRTVKFSFFRLKKKSSYDLQRLNGQDYITENAYRQQANETNNFRPAAKENFHFTMTYGFGGFYCSTIVLFIDILCWTRKSTRFYNYAMIPSSSGLFNASFR